MIATRRGVRRWRKGPGVHESRYGYTARIVRCDRCLVDYLPQHVERVGRWSWWCGNCCYPRDGASVPTIVESRVWLRYRYANEPEMLRALGLDAVVRSA